MDLEKRVSESIAEHLGVNALSPDELTFATIYDEDRKIVKINLKHHAAFFILKIRGDRVVKAEDRADDAMEQEYEKLSAIAKLSDAGARFSMSLPIAKYPEHKALLMSGCEGELAKDLVNYSLANPFKRKALQTLLYDCGAWLGKLHSQGHSSQPFVSFRENRLSHLQRMIDNLSRFNSLYGLNLDRLQAYLSHQMAEVGETHCGIIHGNFALRNILVNDGAITAIDFEDSREECAAYEVGQFVAELAFKQHMPLVGQSVCQDVIDAFLAGYGKHMSYSTHLLNVFVVYHLFAHFYEMRNRLEKSKQPLTFILDWRLRFLAKRIAMLIRD